MDGGGGGSGRKTKEARRTPMAITEFRKAGDVYIGL